VWQSGLNVHQAHDGRVKRHCARLLQFTLQTWSGWEASRAGAGQMAARFARCGIYTGGLAKISSRPLFAGVAARTNGQVDGGYQRDEQRRPQQGCAQAFYRQRECAGGFG